MWDANLFAYHFKISNISNWAGDGGATLEEKERRCGVISEWTWKAGDARSGAQVEFDLPVLIGDGCVENGISDAGGPYLHCQKMGVTMMPPLRNVRTAVSQD